MGPRRSAPKGGTWKLTAAGSLGLQLRAGEGMPSSVCMGRVNERAQAPKL